MTTINTSDDLLRLLEEDAQFYQAARRLILTNELLELPTRFNAFVDRVDQFITKQEQFNEQQRQIQRGTASVQRGTASVQPENRDIHRRAERQHRPLRGRRALRRNPRTART